MKKAPYRRRGGRALGGRRVYVRTHLLETDRGWREEEASMAARCADPRRPEADAVGTYLAQGNPSVY